MAAWRHEIGRRISMVSVRAHCAILVAHLRGALPAERIMHKDIDLALDAARRLEIPLPTAERADEVLERAQALGYEPRDLAALFQALELMANGDGARR
jgi:3-hydroxyisobutyrate dehydrogenase-like beta-hydroxyacid dehydrogenase